MVSVLEALRTNDAKGGPLRRAWALNWPLTLAVLVNLALIPLLLAGMAADPKIIAGVNGWIKPLKFAVSIVIYCATFLWLLSFVQGRWPRRVAQFAASASAFALLVEIFLIALQVERGTQSHFNVGTTFDAAVYGAMGSLIMLVTVCNLLLAILLLVQRMPDPVLAWALRLGVLITLLGMGVGPLMTSGPTPAQLEAAGGQRLTVAGAHSIGVDDGGPGLPLLGWSTEGGDLRVGHFAGLHGMQVLPLVGYVLTRPGAQRRWSPRRRTALVWIAGGAYLGLTVLVTWQALRGQSLIAPDALTLTVGGAGAAIALLLAAAAIALPRR